MLASKVVQFPCISRLVPLVLVLPAFALYTCAPFWRTVWNQPHGEGGLTFWAHWFITYLVVMQGYRGFANKLWCSVHFKSFSWAMSHCFFFYGTSWVEVFHKSKVLEKLMTNILAASIKNIVNVGNLNPVFFFLVPVVCSTCNEQANCRKPLVFTWWS